MAEVKSDGITKADNMAGELESAHLAGAFLREKMGVYNMASALSSGDVIRLVRVKSHWRLSDVLLTNTAIASTGAGNIGLYDTEANGGAVVDADLFGSAVAFTAANGNASVAHESGELTPVEAGKRLWEALGLSADPRKDYDVAITLTANAGGTGSFNVKVRFVE